MTGFRVLNLVADSSKGGAQKVAEQLNDVINSSGSESAVVYLDQIGDRFSELGRLSVFNFIFKVLTTAKVYCRVLAKKWSSDIDVTISHIDRADWLNAFTNLPFTGKSVIYCHGSKLADLNYLGTIGRIRRRLTYSAYRKADAVICVSKGLQDELVEHAIVDQDKVLTIYNWIDYRELKQLSERPLASRYARIQRTDRKIYVVSARLDIQKDIVTVLQAFSSATFDEVPFLLIVGDGDEYDALLTVACSSGLNVCSVDEVPDPDYHDIAFVGFQKNPFPFVSLADTVLSSSIWEGFPLSSIEALLLEKKVILNDCPHGPRELVSLANELCFPVSVPDEYKSRIVPMRGGRSDLSLWIKVLEENASRNDKGSPLDIQELVKVFSPETAKEQLSAFLSRLIEQR